MNYKMEVLYLFPCIDTMAISSAVLAIKGEKNQPLKAELKRTGLVKRRK